MGVFEPRPINIGFSTLSLAPTSSAQTVNSTAVVVEWTENT